MMKNLKVAHVKDVEVDKTVTNYDYSVYSVSGDRDSTFVYKHDGVFYNLVTRDPFDTPVEAFVNFVKNNK